ncbi:MAG: hypothetical protein AAGM67_19615, partial [Bacteroidota bacterium]
VYQVVWSWNEVKSGLELWRFLTPFCYVGSFDFNTLIATYTLVQFSKQYESGGPFNTGAGGGTADYAFCWLLGASGILLSYPFLLAFFSLPPIFCKSMIYYILYIWSKRHPTNNANIWGIPVGAIYLPFAYLALTVFMGNPYMDMIHGMAVGHLYYFMVDVIPVVYGRDVLQTPRFLIDYFGVGEYTPPVPDTQQPRGGFGGFGGNATPARNVGNDAASGGRGGGGGGHQWGGGGHRLGTD